MSSIDPRKTMDGEGRGDGYSIQQGSLCKVTGFPFISGSTDHSASLWQDSLRSYFQMAIDSSDSSSHEPEKPFHKHNGTVYLTGVSEETEHVVLRDARDALSELALSGFDKSNKSDFVNLLNISDEDSESQKSSKEEAMTRIEQTYKNGIFDFPPIHMTNVFIQPVNDYLKDRDVDTTRMAGDIHRLCQAIVLEDKLTQKQKLNLVGPLVDTVLLEEGLVEKADEPGEAIPTTIE